MDEADQQGSAHLFGTDPDLEWTHDDGIDGVDGVAGPEERERVRIVRQGGQHSTRMTVRMPARTREELMFWAGHHGMSMSEYVTHCVDTQILREQGKVDNETLLSNRMNQMVDMIAGMSASITNLETVVNESSRMMGNLISGDTVLTDDDDGWL